MGTIDLDAGISVLSLDLDKLNHAIKNKKPKDKKDDGRSMVESLGGDPSILSERTIGIVKNAECCKSNPLTPKGRKIQLFYMIFLPSIPIVLLLYQCMLSLITSWRMLHLLEVTKKDIAIVNEYFTLLKAIQQERATVATVISIPETLKQFDLPSKFENTNYALQSISVWPEFRLTNAPIFKSPIRFHIRLQDHREKIESYLKFSKSTKMTRSSDNMKMAEWYDIVISGFLKELDTQTSKNSIGKVWKPMISLKNTLHAIENLSNSNIFGMRYFIEGILISSYFKKFVTYNELGLTYLQLAFNVNQEASHDYDAFLIKFGGNNQVKAFKKTIYRNELQEKNATQTKIFAKLMEKHILGLYSTAKKIKCLLKIIAKNWKMLITILGILTSLSSYSQFY